MRKPDTITWAWPWKAFGFGFSIQRYRWDARAVIVWLGIVTLTWHRR